MPYNSNFALTNSQLRDQGIQGALENFMGYFKSVRAQKDEEEQANALKAISQADTAAQGATTGAARLGMDAAGMPTGMQGAGVEPAQAAQQHLATIKANYLNKYGKMPATGQDMLAADLDREDKIAGYGDNRDARTAKKAQAGKVEAFGKTIDADSTLTPSEKSFYAVKPEAFGDRLKPAGITYLPSPTGYVGMPNKSAPGAAPGAAAPVTLPGGAPVLPPAPKDPAPIRWVDKVDAQGKTYQVNPVTGETRDTGRDAPQKAGQMVADPKALAEKAKAGISIIDQMIGAGETGKAHPGFSGAVGAKGISQGFGMFKEPVAGSKESDFKALLNQIGGQAFLDARQGLKGGGPITDMEGTKAQQAITRMSTAQSEADFVKAAKEYRNFLAKEAQGPKASDDDILKELGL